MLTFTLARRVIGLCAEPDARLPLDYLAGLTLTVSGEIAAWGFSDGVIYMPLSLLERGKKHRLPARIQATGVVPAAVAMPLGG